MTEFEHSIQEYTVDPLQLTKKRIDAATVPEIHLPYGYEHTIVDPIIIEPEFGQTDEIARLIATVPHLNPTTHAISDEGIEVDHKKDVAVHIRLEQALATIEASILDEGVKNKVVAKDSYDAIQSILHIAEEKTRLAEKQRDIAIALVEEKRDVAIAAIRAQFGRYALDLSTLANGETAEHERAAISSHNHFSGAEAISKMLTELISADMAKQPILESERDIAITTLDTLAAQTSNLQEDLADAVQSLEKGTANRLALEKAKQGIFREQPGLRDNEERELNIYLTPYKNYITENKKFESESAEMKEAVDYIMKNFPKPESLVKAMKLVVLRDEELMTNAEDFKVATAAISKASWDIQKITDQLATLPAQQQEAQSLLAATKQKLTISEGNSETAENVAQIFRLINQGEIDIVVQSPIPAELFPMIDTKTTTIGYLNVVDRVVPLESLTRLAFDPELTQPDTFDPELALLDTFMAQGAESFETTRLRVRTNRKLAKTITLLKYATGQDVAEKIRDKWTKPRIKTTYHTNV